MSTNIYKIITMLEEKRKNFNIFSESNKPPMTTIYLPKKYFIKNFT